MHLYRNFSLHSFHGHCLFLLAPFHYSCFIPFGTHKQCQCAACKGCQHQRILFDSSLQLFLVCIHLSIHSFIHPSIFLFFHPSSQSLNYLLNHHSIYLSCYLSVYQTIYVFSINIYLLMHSSLYLFICTITSSIYLEDISNDMQSMSL